MPEKITIKEMMYAVDYFLKSAGLKGPNFEETPKRVATFWADFLSQSASHTKTFPLRTEPGMIVLKGITLWGFCPHHLLPVKYNFKIGYIPISTPLGASKPARLSHLALSLLPLQEELPQMVVELIEKAVETKGAGCIVTGEHLCMQMRGIKQPCSLMVTDYLTGVFKEDLKIQERFYNLAKGGD